MAKKAALFDQSQCSSCTALSPRAN